ncbi:putative quinol monooxygenase [Nannocystis radixulma]|uniref:Antibiotic biosynthesis monooxygenase n=1 Tax=Nannocystis radixulma TaxID=2995305 RepID=A0ABT5BN68_9BACT|nr:antibiotic biosynthesis monooxygenase family protein [Nannocystis radixulma]MDC0675616.1 antibiotic biosynthesis monooxygenase [Nannocystis radixulma]
MIVEYIRYRVPTDPEAFEAAYHRASESLRASPVCLAYELSRCEEAPEHYILRIEWTSTADHLQGFRRSPEFGPFFQAIRPWVAQIEEMRHYAPTGLTWRRD